MGAGKAHRVKCIVYSLSPYQQDTMPGLWREAVGKIFNRTLGDWERIGFVLVPVIGTYTYAQNYKEKEKLEHRY